MVAASDPGGLGTATDPSRQWDSTGGRQGELALTGVRRLFSCTPSRLAAFDCPRRYRLTYLQRPAPPKGPPWAHNSLGAVVHLALHRWWTAPRARRTPELAGQLVEHNWSRDGFRDEEQSTIWRARARQWVEPYVAELDPDDDPIGVERTVAVKTDGLAVSGRADRIDDRDGELVVVDYKTGRRALTEDDARGSQALALYALGASRIFRRACRRVELHHLPSGTVAAYEHTEASLSRQVQRAQQTADDIVAATDTLAAGADPDDVFPPVPGPHCSWCDMRRHCAAGRAVSVRKDPWAALEQNAG